MNILPLVSALILLIGCLTYNNLVSYRESEPLRRQYLALLQARQSQDELQVAKQQYNATHFSKTTSGESKNKGEGMAKFNISFLFEGIDDERVDILKRLMSVLYGTQNWFREAIDERPALLDDLLRAIFVASREQRVHKIEDLASLNLCEAQLNEVFYKMLKGMQQRQKENQELPPSEGYYSLYNFIHMKATNKVRLYLAPKELLLALFQDPLFVDEILSERRRLYLMLKTEKDEDLKMAAALTEDFKALFTARPGTYDDERYLDFTVNKTNPIR